MSGAAALDTHYLSPQVRKGDFKNIKLIFFNIRERKKTFFFQRCVADSTRKVFCFCFCFVPQRFSNVLISLGVQFLLTFDLDSAGRH